MSKHLLILGLVWPEPNSSAAGSRMIRLIELFLLNGWEITFASAAQKSEFSYLPKHDKINEAVVQVNDSTWMVKGFVDSENSFGGMMRGSFLCLVTYRGEMAICEDVLIF
jgi:hypothetical protein